MEPFRRLSGWSGTLLVASQPEVVYFVDFSDPDQLASAQSAFAQDESEQRLGTVHFATSCNETAQRRFDRGMRYQHSFWYRQAKETGIPRMNPELGWMVAIFWIGRKPRCEVSMAPAVQTVRTASRVSSGDFP